MSDIREITATSAKLAELVRPLAPPSGIVFVLDTASVGASWSTSVEDGSRSLLQHLGTELAKDTTDPIVVVLGTGTTATGTGVTSAALAAAARGTIGTAALEAAPTGRRVNTVLVNDTSTPRDIRAVLTYLVDEDGAG
ncbi:MAG: hypothetical protein ACRDTJ_33965, partial [Pseudonocardiaceae bacterium]